MVIPLYRYIYLRVQPFNGVLWANLHVCLPLRRCVGLIGTFRVGNQSIGSVGVLGAMIRYIPIEKKKTRTGWEGRFALRSTLKSEFWTLFFFYLF